MVLLFFLMFLMLIITVSTWIVYEKAGQPGWACTVPFYHILIQLKMADKPSWHLIYFFVPFYNIFYAVNLQIEIARCFGKESGFGRGMALLPFVYYPMLAFSDANYVIEKKQPGKTMKKKKQFLSKWIYGHLEI
jgi:hypothetical protein